MCEVLKNAANYFLPYLALLDFLAGGRFCCLALRPSRFCFLDLVIILAFCFVDIADNAAWKFQGSLILLSSPLNPAKNGSMLSSGTSEFMYLSVAY